MKNKKILILCICLIVIGALIITLVVINPFKKKEVVVDTTDVEKKINKIGEIYYKNYYYNYITDKTVLSNFEDNGISISLTNLTTYKNIDDDISKLYDKELVDFLNKYKCNFDTTKVVIIPSEPFGEKDFKVINELDCNF